MKSLRLVGGSMLMLLMVVWLTRDACSQGFLLVDPEQSQEIRLPRPWPRPPHRIAPASYKIKELAVEGRIRDQVAELQVTQSFVNTGSRTMMVSFLFPLPYDGAIDRLTFMVEGKEYEAKLLPADQARSIFESYVRRAQDPALLEWMGKGMFKTSVFPVPPGAERKVTIQFSQLLRRYDRMTDLLYPLTGAKYTSQPIESFRIQLAVESQGKIKSVYSPTHSIEVTRPNKKRALVKYAAQNHVPSTDFRLLFDTSGKAVSSSLLTYRPEQGEDGYFLLLTTPEMAEPKEVVRKTAVMVLDRSGSMAGKKMEQARDALRFVLNNLNENDLFNIIAYDSKIETFKSELQRYDSQTRAEAMGFVEGLYSGGSTNIDGALKTAMEMVAQSDRPTYVIFLTDGLPTVGEKNPAKIAENATRNNKNRARLISFGVGYDVNSQLLDRLSRNNFGESEYVRPDEDLEAYVGRLYRRISSPVMSEVSVQFKLDGRAASDGPVVNRVYPRKVYDLFAGEQLVMVGRYRPHGKAKIIIQGKVGNETSRFDFAGKFESQSADASLAFVEKLWAVRRIGEIIDELDLEGKNEELIQELIALSTKHGVLTPYTSFLADDQPDGRLANRPESLGRARRLLEQLDETQGRSAFAQRAEKKVLQSAQTIAPAAPAGGGGFGGGVRYRDVATDKEVVKETVRVLQNETLYKRGKLWIATSAQDVDPEKDKDKIIVIKRFSPEYFELVAANTSQENEVLAAQQDDEQLLIQLRGKIYRIQ